MVSFGTQPLGNRIKTRVIVSRIDAGEIIDRCMLVIMRLNSNQVKSAVLYEQFYQQAA